MKNKNVYLWLFSNFLYFRDLVESIFFFKTTINSIKFIWSYLDNSNITIVILQVTLVSFISFRQINIPSNFFLKNITFKNKNLQSPDLDYTLWSCRRSFKRFSDQTYDETVASWIVLHYGKLNLKCKLHSELNF